MTDDTYGIAQFYTQRAHILYMIDPDGNQLSIYNMLKNTFTPNWISTYNAINVGGTSCLASTMQYLFIVGGTSTHNTVQMLDLLTREWINNNINIPSMQTARGGHACIINPETNILYAIAGSHPSNGSFLASIERIETNEIWQNTWQYIEPLTQSTNGLRCIIYNNMIYIVGGFTGSMPYVDIVHVINTTTNTVLVLSEPSAYGATGTSAIAVHNILYAFGGTNGANIDKWMKYALLSIIYNITLTLYFITF